MIKRAQDQIMANRQHDSFADGPPKAVNNVATFNEDDKGAEF